MMFGGEPPPETGGDAKDLDGCCVILAIPMLLMLLGQCTREKAPEPPPYHITVTPDAGKGK